jgi:diguanylate cyclase (GGDEF)-like protein
VSDDEHTRTVVISSDESKDLVTPAEGVSWIVLLHPPGPDLGRRMELRKAEYSIGRDQAADVVISRDSVSRRHARIVRDERGGFRVEDLGSTNGTFVNDQRISERTLVDGDQLRFGDAIFKFLSGQNVESAYHEEIYRMTILDGLTGVHNKRYFLEFLEREIASSRRHARPLSLVILDIDHFKRINDERGHLAGDAVLKQLVNRVRPRIRREDLFARYGGEEFAAILTVTGLAGGVRFSEQIRQLVADQLFTFNGERFPVTVSLGVAVLAPADDVTELIARADENLYAAKHGGRNQVVPAPGDVTDD